MGGAAVVVKARLCGISMEYHPSDSSGEILKDRTFVKVFCLQFANVCIFIFILGIFGRDSQISLGIELGIFGILVWLFVEAYEAVKIGFFMIVV